MTFRIGDKVEIISGPGGNPGHRIGDIGLVIKHDPREDTWPWTVKVPDKAEGVYSAREIRLVANAEPDDPFTRDVRNVFEANRDLLMKKHADYGPGNISTSPGGPMLGLAVRMNDKLARLSHLLSTGAKPENESLRDTLVDLSNYAAIGILVIDGNWPKGDN